MTNWIETINEPSRLILGWQAPDHLKNRFRWAVGELTHDESRVIFRYFSDSEFSHHNQGKSESELLGLGYRGYPAFNPKKEIHDTGVLEAFMRRTPPRSRSDFEEYLRGFRVKSDTVISDFALLGLTEARLPSDGFSLIDALDCSVEKCELFLEVAGYRYYSDSGEFSAFVGKMVDLEPEEKNPQDPNAVVIRAGGLTIGYINRLQASSFKCWLRHKRVSGVLEKLNGSADKPRAFIFVRVSRQAQCCAA